jgi:hypothetical protein
MESDGTSEWETCVVDEDYEICVNYPHQLRKKETGNILKESIYSNGYVRVVLSNSKYCKHRLIALQFIPNPENYPDVDHINRIRTDNRIENLRFVSASSNSKNRSGNGGVEYKFVDEISPDAIHVTEYGEHEFDELYFYDNQFLYFNGVQYRILHITKRHNGALSVTFRDINHINTTIYYSKFKRMYDLI